MNIPGRATETVSAARALAELAEQPDDAIDLADAALTLAACAHPGKKLEPYRDHLRALAESLKEAAAKAEEAETAEARAHLLHDVMVERWRYHGDAETFEDPQNADLMGVIDRRKGLPVSLGILYLHTARSLGWKAHGLNFPGHFLIRIDTEIGERVIIDPFHDGQTVGVAGLRALLKAISGPAAELTPQTYAPASNRDVLVRLHNTIKLRHLEAGRFEQALETVQQMLLMAPRDHRLWREAGLMHMRLGDLEGALEHLDTYLTLAPPGTDRQRIEEVLHELRHRMH